MFNLVAKIAHLLMSFFMVSSGCIRSNCLFISANLRKTVNEGRADCVSIFLSQTPELFRRHYINLDVGMTCVALLFPPERGLVRFTPLSVVFVILIYILNIYIWTADWTSKEYRLLFFQSWHILVTKWHIIHSLALFWRAWPEFWQPPPMKFEILPLRPSPFDHQKYRLL